MKKIIICLITVLMLFATIGCSNQYEGLSKIENDNLEELEVHLGVVFSFIEELKKYVAYMGSLITKLKSTLKP